MSRQIKFRFFPVKGRIYPHGGVMRYSDNFTSVDLVEGEHWKVMQSAGLLDKNGKDIYEGDIIMRHWSGYDTKLCVVEFVAPEYRMRNISSKKLVGMDIGPLEVIGNIFEHNHLLEATK